MPRTTQGEDLPRLPAHAAGSPGWQAHPCHRHESAPGRWRENHHQRRPQRRALPPRQALDRLPARTVARPLLRHEGWRRRRWLLAGRADGGHQPAFHRRFPRHRQRAQPARGDDRQLHPPWQCRAHRHPADHLAARHGHERPGLARVDNRPRRPGQRFSARIRIRHRPGQRGDGGVLSRRVAGRSEATAPERRRRPDAGG